MTLAAMAPPTSTALLLLLFTVLATVSADSRKGVLGATTSSPFLSARRCHRNPRSTTPFYPAPARAAAAAAARDASPAGHAALLRRWRGGGEEAGGAPPNNIVDVTSLSQWQDLLDAAARDDPPRLVVLDFAADRCPPCEMIAPVYADLSRLDEFRHVAFCKVNVSERPEVAARHGVDGWPTFVLFKGGAAVDRVVGGQAAKAGLYDLVAKHA